MLIPLNAVQAVTERITSSAKRCHPALVRRGALVELMKDVTFYWLPNCSTCQKALGWLGRRGVKIATMRDIKDEPLIRKEVENLAKMLGGPAELFSKRAVKYREMNLNEREVPPAEMLDLMTNEYTFLKRPILVIGDHATAGFFEKSFDSFLKQHYYPQIQTRQQQRRDS